MRNQNAWIWLPETEYPHAQKGPYSALEDGGQPNYRAARFQRTYVWDRKAVRLHLRVSGDTAFRLLINGQVVMTGPACVGGDFIGNERARNEFYAYSVEWDADASALHFEAQVVLSPVQICEYSMGHGGFMLEGEALLEDGSVQPICTDESWLACAMNACVAPCMYDNSQQDGALVPAVRTEDIWHVRTAPIPPRTEHVLAPEKGAITLRAHQQTAVFVPLDRIYAGYVHAKASGPCRLTVCCRELEEKGTQESFCFAHAGAWRGFYLHSAGGMLVQAENLSDADVQVQVQFIATHYPAPVETCVHTGDADVDLVMEVCRHTLKYCRQTHHLDSPRHTEPLACTGDYYIETLMTLFSFGDMRLAAFDLMRTARMLERHDGRMFHTAYSLIWVLMLRDVYLFTGEKHLLMDCEKGLLLLLKRFRTYLGENGLIETPPDYMFVDWIYLDGHSLHHPPKALGQSCLNMYYFAALSAAAEIFGYLGEKETQQTLKAEREALRKAIHRELFDAEKQAFIAGLNTETPENLLGFYMPANTEKRYITKHANILAACFGVCGDDLARELIHRIMRDEIEGDIQPYFTHYLLEAVFRLDLREEYTLPIIRRWTEPVKACPKGLVEGFVKPEPTYSFDHSHAWGGTPLYALPRALCGLRVLEPGMGKLGLAPRLLGLPCAHFTLHTPHGPVVIDLEAGKEKRITHPDRVEVYVKA